MSFFRTPNYNNLGWDDLEETIILVESLGYDSVFVADHLFLGDKGRIWECWTTLSAIAGFTNKILLSPIHLCDSFRNPALVAKMISTLDHISNKRLINFYDYGWREKEFSQYGYDFLNTENRIDKMREGLIIINGLLYNNNFSYKGKYYCVENAICSPKPDRKIPLWLGETAVPEMLDIVVEFADVFNSMPVSIEGFEKKMEILKKVCSEKNRSFDSLGKSLETQVLIVDSNQEKEDIFGHYKELLNSNNSEDGDIITQLKKVNPQLKDLSDPSQFEHEFMIGTVKDIKEKINSFIQLGVDHFILWFMDYPMHKSIIKFADELLPVFKQTQ